MKLISHILRCPNKNNRFSFILKFLTFYITAQAVSSHDFSIFKPNQQILLNSLNQNSNSTLFGLIKPENINKTAISRNDLINFINDDYKFTIFKSIKFNNPEQNYNIKLTKSNFTSGNHQETIAKFLSEKPVLQEILSECKDDHCIEHISNLIQKKSGETEIKNSFHFIASRGLSEVVDKICGDEDFREIRKLVNSRDENQNTGLIFASFNGHQKTVDEILECEIFNSKLVNFGNNFDGMTALMYASIMNHPEVVEVLVKNKFINVNQKTIEAGSTALMFAAEGGYTDVAKQLLDSDSIDLTVVNHCKPRYEGSYCKPKKQNAFMMAASWNRLEIVELILNHEQFDSRLCDAIDGHDNSTAVMLAVSNGFTDVVQAIIDKENNCEKVVDSCEKMCDLEIKNWYGWTVDDIAYLNDLVNVTKVLDSNYEPGTIVVLKRFSTFYFYWWLFLFNGFLPFGIVGWLFWAQFQNSKKDSKKNPENEVVEKESLMTSETTKM